MSSANIENNNNATINGVTQVKPVLMQEPLAEIQNCENLPPGRPVLGRIGDGQGEYLYPISNLGITLLANKCSKLVDQVKDLEGQVERARANYGLLEGQSRLGVNKQELESLQLSNEKLKLENKDLKERVTNLESENEYLKERVAKLENLMFASIVIFGGIFAFSVLGK